jgi:hypothetical protein
MLEGITPPRSGVHRCKVDTYLAELDETDSEILGAAINDNKKWPAQTLAMELRKRGLVMSDASITRHRRKTCACYREVG